MVYVGENTLKVTQEPEATGTNAQNETATLVQSNQLINRRFQPVHESKTAPQLQLLYSYYSPETVA